MTNFKKYKDEILSYYITNKGWYSPPEGFFKSLSHCYCVHNDIALNKVTGDEIIEWLFKEEE